MRFCSAYCIGRVKPLRRSVQLADRTARRQHVVDQEPLHRKREAVVVHRGRELRRRRETCRRRPRSRPRCKHSGLIFRARTRATRARSRSALRWPRRAASRRCRRWVAVAIGVHPARSDVEHILLRARVQVVASLVVGELRQRYRRPTSPCNETRCCGVAGSSKVCTMYQSRYGDSACCSRRSANAKKSRPV